ncbi:MAG TPA: TolC family protein [Polyangiaceae bacterium]|nr:TolC family protein [Polyangiaceae bacterium]
MIGRCALALLALALPAGATQPLESFLRQAEQQSFDTREARATEQQRSSEAQAALGRLLPSLSARGVYTRNQSEAAITVPGDVPRSVVITPLNQLDAFAQLDVPIIDLANHHRYHAAVASAEGASAQREAAVIDVSRSVARAYYQFLGASALVRSAESSIGAAQANLTLVDERRGAGAATDLDHERAAASLARAQQDSADAVLGVQLAARSLETLSGLSPAPAQEFPEDDLHLEGPLDGWMARAGATPIVRAARRQQHAAEENRKAAGLSLLPTLGGSAQERVTNATGFAGRSSAYTLQLTLSWRFDYGLLATHDAQSAALDAQLVRVERTERAAQDATYEAYRRVEAGIAKSRAARVQEQAAARAAELSEARYEAGVATQLDVTQAQRDAFLASAARIQSDSDLAYARASLRLAVGASVTSGSPAAPENNP